MLEYQEGESLARRAIALDNSTSNGFFELAETSALCARDLGPQNSQVDLLLAKLHVTSEKHTWSASLFLGVMAAPFQGESPRMSCLTPQVDWSGC
jgi:hypothetical protein